MAKNQYFLFRFDYIFTPKCSIFSNPDTIQIKISANQVIIDEIIVKAAAAQHAIYARFYGQ